MCVVLDIFVDIRNLKTIDQGNKSVHFCKGL